MIMESLSETAAVVRSPYSPLEDTLGAFRLINLLPVTESDRKIRCELEHASLCDDPVPIYEALSYVWGDPQRERKTIYLDGFAVKVTESLFSALLRIRKGSDRARRLWIDALCINQEDQTERSSQVQQMRHIYSSADQVLVYLGEHGHRKPSGIQPLLLKLARIALIKLAGKIEAEKVEAEAVNKTADSFRKPDPITIQDALRIAPDMFNDEEAWSDLVELLGQPWFSRVWTVQEIAVSKDAELIIGPYHISWHFLEAAASIVPQLCSSVKSIRVANRNRITDDSTQLPDDLSITKQQRQILEIVDHCLPKSLLSIRDKVHSMPKSLFSILGDKGLNRVPLDMLELLKATRSRRASDKRDKLFAIIGLCNTQETDDFQANYSKTTTAVFEEFTANVVPINGNLDLLMLAGLTTNKLEGLPSWCPDYSQVIHALQLEQHNYWFLDRADSDRWTASGSRDTSVSFLSGPRTQTRRLCLEGIVVSRVGVSIPAHFEKQQQELYKIREKAISEGRIKNQCHKRLEWHEDVEFYPKYIGATSGTAYTGNWEEAVNSATPSESFSLFLLHLRLMLQRPCIGDRASALLISQDDHFVAAGPQAREGDYLCVLLGGRSAFLLRPVEDNTDEWLLVGACFASGIMRGEILREVEEGKRQVREFVIV